MRGVTWPHGWLVAIITTALFDVASTSCCLLDTALACVSLFLLFKMHHRHDLIGMIARPPPRA